MLVLRNETQAPPAGDFAALPRFSVAKLHQQFSCSRDPSWRCRALGLHFNTQQGIRVPGALFGGNMPLRLAIVICLGPLLLPDMATAAADDAHLQLPVWSIAPFALLLLAI